MRIGLKAKLKKLEGRRNKRQSSNRVLHCRAQDLAAYADNAAALPVWLMGHYLPGQNPASGPLGAYTGRFMLLPTFDTAAEWEAAAEQQQRALIAVARSRTNEPMNVAPVSVGTIPDDVPAPTRKGEKGKRFVFLQDGRTFDRDSGQYVNEGG